ncbi:MAG: nucleoid-associated protein [Saprospirales bacterium]|nr:nucleoid-associated protein [Saprospirales bacterium]MBK8489409.1 nucleoid-associated protein [Saprospirales bacterium]
MFQFDNIQLKHLALHRVGNRHREETNFFSNALLDPHEDVEVALKRYFLRPFKKASSLYRFQHSSDLQLNEVYSYAQKIFEDPLQLLEQSRHIVEHLYNQSNHPNIKTGEVYVAYFSDLLLEDELVDAIGIFKSERKSAFLKITEYLSSLQLSRIEGIDIDQFDKGCLIADTLEEDGYRLFTVDNNNYDAQYWPYHFLNVDFVEDKHFHTMKYLELCDDFSRSFVAPQSDKREQLHFMAQAADYFQQNDAFQLNEFTERFLPDEPAQHAFSNLRTDYGLDQVSNFPISPQALKESRRLFKNRIQLDTKIQIQLDFQHPDISERFLERGFDEERGMHYYKVYFNEEL